MPPKATDPTAAPTSNPRSVAESTSSNSKSTAAAEKRRIAATAASNTAAQAGAAVANGLNPNGTHAHEGIEGMDFSTMPTRTLHSYRSTFRLPNVTSTCEPYASMVLASAIGKKSPTTRARRTSRDALVTAVRKHFNAWGVNENEVVVGFLYGVRNQDKAFRLRILPGGTNTGARGA